MARRLTYVPYDLSPEPAREELFSGAAIQLDANIELEPLFQPVSIHLGLARRWRYRLSPDSTGRYPVSTTAIVTQAARGGYLVREWAAIEPMYSQPADTLTECRIHDGDGTSYYWNGAAWQVAGASDWTTPELVAANASTIDAELLPKVGLEWRLSTQDAEATPYVYGGMAAAGLWFGARTGATAEETLSDSWADDLIHRVLVPWLRSLDPERTDEGVTSTYLSIRDYSGGPGQGSGWIVREATVAYDLTDDPEMQAPLSTSWNAATKELTFTPAVPAGHRYAVRLIGVPTVVFGGDRDLFLAGIPQVVIESIGVVTDGPGYQGDDIVRDIASAEAFRIPAGRPRSYPMVLLLQSDGQVSALEIHAALERAMNSRGGIVLISEGTGMPVQLRITRQLRPARTGMGMAAAARVDLTADVVEYHGAAEVGPLIQDGGVVPTVRAPRAS